MSFKANFSSDSANSSARFNPGGVGATFSPKFNSGNSGGSGGGENGATFYPSVAENGDLSWSNDKGLENPAPVNIKGPKGADGYTPVKGVDYFDGKDGTAGYTPVKGVDYFDGKDGEDGSDGKTPVKGVDYFDGTNGKDGTSVTVSNVSTSSDDGGSNVVTFSDGKTLTVKNGRKGSTGAKGADGKTPVKGTDYFTEADKQETKNEIISSIVTQEAGQSESLVMSQKAVTDLVSEAIGTGGTSYETVDSVEKMTDTSKSYVLSTTGTIWSYGETTVTVEPPNKFVPSKASLNYRLSGSSGTASANAAANGSFVTDFIAVSNMATIDPYIMRANWEWDGTGNGEDKIVYYDSNKTRLGNTVFDVNNRKNVTVLDGEFLCSLKVNEYEAINVSNWADVAFIRLQLFVKPKGTSITSADVANLTITFDHEGGTKTESAWYDTGLTPSASGGGGGNYVDLLVKVNENKTDIAEVSNRVTALETESDSLTVPTFWQSAVDACISKIKALQVGRNCITFPFFSDNHQRNGYAGVLIAKVMKECNIPYCFFGGDSISNGYIESEAVMIEQDKAFDTIMSYIPNGRFCRAVGNHDGFWNVSSATGDEYHYTDAQIYELFLREESIAQNKHFGGDGTYYYVDDIASKVRWVVLDTNDSTVEAEQISWLQNTALTFNESGWAVVFISHQPISNHYHALISNSAEVRTVVKNYINGSSANKADVVGWFSGHIHRDRIYTGIATNTTDDSQGTAMGFTQITITSDHTGIAYDDATKHTVANDDKSHAIDFVTINKATKTVNITRLGIGEDRSYTY